MKPTKMKIEYCKQIDSETAPWLSLTNVDELQWNGVYSLRVSNDDGSHNLPFRLRDGETVTLVVKDHSHPGKLQGNRTIVQEITHVDRSTGCVSNYSRFCSKVNGKPTWSNWTDGDNNRIVWNEVSHINEFITAGIYNIAGERTNVGDGLPFANSNPGHTFHARLVVLDSSINDSEVCVTQVLMLSNRVGGDGNLYVRTGNAASKDELRSGEGWEPWGKLQQNIDVGQVTSLDSFVDNGIYSGVYTVSPTQLETFVMVVINNYAVATAMGEVRNISQFKYALNINGNFSYKTRTGRGNSEIEWGSWVDLGAATTTDIQDGAVTAEKLSADVREKVEKIGSSIGIDSIQITSGIQKVILCSKSINGVNDVEIDIPAATLKTAGVMSAEDKTMLSRVVNVTAGQIIDISTLEYTPNKYLNVSGVEVNSNGFNISEIVYIINGSKVKVTTNSTAMVSVISRVTAEGSFINSIVTGKTGVNTYEWIAPIDCYIRLSVTTKDGAIEVEGIEGKTDRFELDIYGRSYGIRSVYGLQPGAFNSSGTISWRDSFSHSNAVPVAQGDVVRIAGAAVTENISVISAVDENGEYISTIMHGKSAVEDYEYTVQNDGYISISMSRASFDDSAATIITKGLIHDINGLENKIDAIADKPSNLWKGKRIMAIGDSLTASTAESNWQYVMGGLLDCNIRTHAKGGIGLISMVDGDGSEKPEADPDNFGVANIYRLEASDVADVDLILLFGAFNEYRRARDEYGTMTDVYPTQDTYLGRLRYVANRLVETVLEGNPKCKIAFIEPYCFGGGGYCNATGYDVGVDMARGMREVAEEFCFPCIPLLRNSQIARYNWDLYCAGAGKENTTYLPYEESVPYGTPSIFPSADELPSTATEGVIALVASDNTYGYTYAQFKDGVWSLNHWPGGSAEYPVPYIYLWKDFIHLNADGHERIAKYIAGQVNTL